MFAMGAFESPDGRGPEGRGLGVTVMTAVAADFFKAIAPEKKLLKKLRLTNAPDLTNLPTSHASLTPGALSRRCVA
jgi:hypothetical protein